MQLSKESLQILKNFSSINTNLGIDVGTKLTTVSPSMDILAVAELPEKFEKEAGIYNLNELLGVLGLFDSPEVKMFDRHLVVSEGKTKIKYGYAEKSLLTLPPTKPVNMPTADVTITITADQIAKLQKAASVIGVTELAFTGDGEKVSAKVFDAKGANENNFEIDLGVDSDKKFTHTFKIEKLKLLPSSYTVEFSNKISKWSSGVMNLVYYIALEK